jgi:hypothetical protein
MSGADLVGEMGLEASHVVVIDLKPDREGNVSLYEIRQV